MFATEELYHSVLSFSTQNGRFVKKFDTCPNLSDLLIIDTGIFAAWLERSCSAISRKEMQTRKKPSRSLGLEDGYIY